MAKTRQQEIEEQGIDRQTELPITGYPMTSAEQAEMNKANPERARVVAKQKKSTSSASGAAGAVLPSKNVTKAPSWYSTKVYTPDTAVTKGPKKGPAKKPAVAVKKTIATAPSTLGITPPTFRGPRNERADSAGYTTTAPNRSWSGFTYGSKSSTAPKVAAAKKAYVKPSTVKKAVSETKGLKWFK